jgi:hypothetical protein
MRKNFSMQGDQMIRKKAHFSKSSQNSLQAKKMSKYPHQILKHLHQTSFEHLKYPQQTMF